MVLRVFEISMFLSKICFVAILQYKCTECSIDLLFSCLILIVLVIKIKISHCKNEQLIKIKKTKDISQM